MTDIWDIKPAICYMLNHFGRGKNFPYYNAKDMDAWLEKLRIHYEPYDELLKAEPLMPLDIRSVLKKEGMPILVDEGRFNELKEKAEKWDLIEKVGPGPSGDALLQWHLDITGLRIKLEAVKKLVEAGPYPHMNTWRDYQRAVDDWLGKMMNVLEVEE